ncbi:MAG: hypothetical protein Q4G08_02370 [Capnocytophaga sp.]|nr:hypothetical protein [Capnocytophaga sp.]
MKPFLKILTVTTLFFAVSCGSDSPGSEPEPPKPPVTKIPDPIKENTAQIHFFSTFSEEAIPSETAVYERINEELEGKESHLTLLDKTQTDVQSSRNFNSYIADKQKGIPFFGLNRYSGTIAEGTAIITQKRRGAYLDKNGVANPNTDIKTIPHDVQYTHRIADDCFLTETKTFVKTKTDFPFGIARLETSAHISASKDAVSQLVRRNYVIIGTVPLSLKAEMEQLASSFKNEFRYELEFIQPDGKSRSLFVLKPRSWVIRSSEIKTVTNPLQMITLQIETNVFY